MNKLKYLSFLFAALVSVGCMFTSCDDDDNYPIETQIAGEYKGTLDVSLDGQSVAMNAPQNIKVEKAANNAINLTLANFNMMGMSLGDIKLTDLVLNEQNSGTYSFSGTQSLTLPTPVGTCPVEYFGVITNGNITVNLSITWNEMKVAVAYQGDRLKGTESGEAAITAFSFEGENDFITSQPVINADSTITFSVADTTTVEQLQSLTPVVEVSAGATYTASGSDFSQDVTYTVVSEDGRNIATYVVRVSSRINSLKYTFDEWTEATSSFLFWTLRFPTPSENGLATCNAGAAMLQYVGYTGDLAVLEDSGYGESGSSAKMVTLRSVGLPMAPAITTGSVFTGSFAINAGDQLSSTSFGIAYDKMPVTMKGVYKYQAGTNFIDGSNKDDVKENTGDEDQGSIIGVLYEATDAEGNDVTLNGHTIGSSDYHVAVATFYCSDQAEWTEFNVNFEMVEGKTYDPSKTYKLALVCSSSKDGNLFKGAENSTLWVDNLEVTGEVVASETTEGGTEAAE